ncbi:MAG: hypothetical protein B6244_09190 [Candidatus Cloacimonetes bacterium 4572_55]|nr:MAG: hypothetical protein B6244_09190 [Candidatus Cloacimonetes bacterium 4572_55]
MENKDRILVDKENLDTSEVIDKDNLLIVEGKDEIGFFEALLAHINAEDKVQIVPVGGKDQFKNEFPTLLESPNFSRVKSYGIVRDADDNADNTFQSVQGLLRRYDQPIPQASGEIISLNGVATGVFIMPGNSEEGMLENLCLKTVDDHPVSDCVDKYIDCLHKTLEHREKNTPKDPNTYYFPKNEAKVKMYAFLAGMNTYIPSLGIAAKKGYFNLNSEILDDIKAFLQKLIGL